MAIHRSPTGNNQANRSNQNANNVNDNNNENSQQVSQNEQHDLSQIIHITDDSLLDFQNPIVPRSTMNVLNNEASTSQLNVQQACNDSNNLINPNHTITNPPEINRPRTTPSSVAETGQQTVSTAQRLCDVCYRSAERYYVLCEGCDKISHPCCLLDEERESMDVISTSFLCLRCDNIYKKLNARPLTASNTNLTPRPLPVSEATCNARPLPVSDNNKDLIAFLGNNNSKSQDVNKVFSVENPEPSPFDNTYSVERHQNNLSNLSLLNGSTEIYLYKLQMRKLPEVHDEGISWNVFYSSFLETKELYSDQENVTRIQAAIKFDKVKRIRGSGLFDLKTYSQTIEYINKRLKNNLNFLLTEAQSLESNPRIKNENKQGLVDFIDKVRNFVVRAVAYKEISLLTNKRFIANISDIIPTYLRNKWEAHQAALEEMGQIPSLQHMNRIFERELPRIEASIRNDSLRGSNKRFEAKSFTEREHHPDKFRKQRFYNTNAVSENKFALSKSRKVPSTSQFHSFNDSKTFSCWLHKSNDHSAYKCNVLWELDGKTVSNLARGHNICTFCGQFLSSDHKPCRNCENLKCKMNGCSFKHHEMFCYKRKGRQNKQFKENSSNGSKNHGSKVYTSQSKNENSSESLPVNNSNNESDEVDKLLASLNVNNLYSNLPCNSKLGQNSHKVSMSINTLESCHKNRTPQTSLLGVIVIKLEGNKQVALLIDSGSSVSLIEENIANELKARGPLYPLTLSWSGNYERTDNRSRIITVKASKIDSESPLYNLGFRTVKDLNVCSQAFNSKQFVESHPKFKSLKLSDYVKIDGIIGIDNPIAFKQKFMVESVNKHGVEYHGIRIALGDYVYGTERPLTKLFEDLHNKRLTINKSALNSHISLSREEENELMEMEREVMGLEYYSDKDDDICIVEEKRIFDLLDKTCKKVDNDNHYIAPLLWKQENIKLPTNESFKMSLRRYLIVEKQALKLGKFQECVDQIQNLIDKNYAREMSEEEIKSYHPKGYYNPVFFIYPPNKRSRLIWDLAAKIDGKSLNDYLLTGPNLYNSMLDIMFRMREDEHFVKGDIGEMFHQIKVDEDDTHSLRFLFRMSPGDKIRVFKMNVLPFGAKCSPFLSQYVKNKVAKDYIAQFPQAANTILNNSYVDDLVKSHNDPLQLAQITCNMKRILADAGFNLLKLNSNSKHVLAEIKSLMSIEELGHEKLFCEENTEKLLGYNVDFQTDTLSLAINSSKWNNTLINSGILPTKRQLLQVLMSLFDPLGLFQFVSSKLKIIFHKTCRANTEWDQLIEEKYRGLWQKALHWLEEATAVRIPRSYCDSREQVCTTQLWNFGDAGDDMLCGVSYVRFLDVNRRQINVRIIYAKTFTVPFKSEHTTPQKELDIASKIVEMSKKIVSTHNIKFDEIYFGSDNSAVLNWIRNGAKKATLFIKNRLTKINELSTPSQWVKIPSELMPADIGTKLESMVEVKYDNNWFIPKLFRMPESKWPKCMSNFVPNAANIHTSMEKVSEESDIHILDAARYSKLHVLLSTGMTAFRWLKITECSKLKRKVDCLERSLKSDKHNKALRENLRACKELYAQRCLERDDKAFNYGRVEKLAIKLAQFQVFEKEISILNKSETLPSNNRIFKLSPLIDKDGILRAKSRIPLNSKNLSEFGYDRIRPIILPKNHNLTKLVILKYHVANKHCLHSSVSVNLMRKYYIQNIKSTVNSVIKLNCFHCSRQNARPQTPFMGSLPEARLAYHLPPFTYSMVDLAGPVIVKNYRNRDIKRWIFVYGCLTTRAVHLELIENLTSDATLMALQNVFNLRGCAKEIYSDLGSSFVGAWTILKAAQTEWNAILLKKGVIIEPIQWVFAPAKAPHFQGAVERMVGLTKMVLKNMITSLNKDFVKYSDFHLRSILYEITALLNNRPLTTVSMSEEGTEILTPNSFLMGRQNIQTMPVVDGKYVCLKDNWQDIKKFTSKIWKHWLCAYIPKIKMREKWLDFKEPLKVGDIVILADPSIANMWRLGRVIEANIGSENQVRSVTIKIGKNDNFTFPINKLTKDQILKIYKEEKHSVVTRPAVAVAKINV